MFTHPPYRKIYPTVASWADMYALANRRSPILTTTAD